MPTSAATNALRMIRNKFMRLASPELSKMINKCTSTTKNLYSAFVGKTTTSQTSLPTSTYDRIIPEVFGVMRFSGNNIWCSDITTTVKKTPSFLIFNSHTTTTIRMSFAVALCFCPCLYCICHLC